MSCLTPELSVAWRQKSVPCTQTLVRRRVTSCSRTPRMTTRVPIIPPRRHSTQSQGTRRIPFILPGTRRWARRRKVRRSHLRCSTGLWLRSTSSSRAQETTSLTETLRTSSTFCATSRHSLISTRPSGNVSTTKIDSDVSQAASQDQSHGDKTDGHGQFQNPSQMQE